MGQVLISLLFDGLAFGMLLFIIAVGLSITMGLMGFINLAHGAFAMAGGYAMVSLTQALGVPFLPALALAFLLVGGASVLFERLLYARLYGASELDQVLSASAWCSWPSAAFTFFYGPSPQRVVVPGLPEGQIDLGARAFPAYRVFLIAVGLGLMAALWLLFERTLIGARIRAAVDNRRMAQSVGIDVEALFTWTFACGSGLAAVGGGLAADHRALADVRIQYLVFFLIVVTVGGPAACGGRSWRRCCLGSLTTPASFLAERAALSSYTSRPWRSCCASRMACSDAHTGPEAARVAGARASVAARHRWRLFEALPWLLAVGAFFRFPTTCSLAPQVLILDPCALSLDLILGYAGISRSAMRRTSGLAPTSPVCCPRTPAGTSR